MSEENYLDEEQIFFKRFPAEKQDQVRGLVNYATLMGLSGKDLVSIGGKLDRLKASQDTARNKEIIQSMNIEPIGGDKGRSDKQAVFDERFKYKTTTGQYNFVRKYSDEWQITSVSTKVTINYHPQSYENIPKCQWQRRIRYAMMLDIAHGLIQLNF
jgi:hypothetical protein